MSTCSINISQKSNQPKPNSQLAAQEQNNSSIDNFDDGGDHNPLKGSLERHHKLTVTSKRKRKINKEGTNEVKPEVEISLEDMELDENIEYIDYPNEEQRV